ncbi:MAG: hypothetical protein ABI823_11620 [Bryobacteraceae bacterium]
MNGTTRKLRAFASCLFAAGTSGEARLRRQSTGKTPGSMFHWADLILAMESKHRSRLEEQFGYLDEMPRVAVLGIPDEFEKMDPELVDQIRERTEAILLDFLRDHT